MPLADVTQRLNVKSDVKTLGEKGFGLASFEVLWFLVAGRMGFCLILNQTNNFLGG